MHKCLMLLLLCAPSAYACELSSPECAAEVYVQSHIEKDVESVYELTAASERGDFEEFAANYHERHVTHEAFQEYWEQNTAVDTSLLQQTNSVARVLVNTKYPDWAPVAFERAKEGYGLDTTSDWEQLVADLQQQDVSIIEKSTEFYLVPEEGVWKVLRPKL